MQGCGEKSGVISANAPATTPAGATVPCIKISVGSHKMTLIWIPSQRFFFVSTSLIFQRVSGAGIAFVYAGDPFFVPRNIWGSQAGDILERFLACFYM